MFKSASPVSRTTRICDVVQLAPRGSRVPAAAAALVAALTVPFAVGIQPESAQSGVSPPRAAAAPAAPDGEFVYFPAQFALDKSESGEHIQAF